MKLDISNHVINGEIIILPPQWQHLTGGYEKEEIKNAISDAIEKYKLPMPLRHICVDDACEDFARLQEFNCTDLIKKGTTFTRYSYSRPLGDEYISSSNIGNKSSDYFHQYNRYCCDSINAPSPYRTWYTKKFRMTFLNALWTLKVREINNSVFRTALALRKFISSQFRPTAAKAIYQRYGAKNVLDFSSGWGDRLCAFHACKDTESYMGIDPNVNLVQGYQKQNSFYNTGKKVQLISAPAEEVALPDDNFDLVFTSPPYFNIERYTQEQNQSWKRYKKLEAWLEGFMFPVLTNSWKSLKRGGVLAINISDVYSNHQINAICDPMNDFIEKLDGAQYETCLGMKMAKRPNSLSEQNGIFVEPIWIWHKD